MVAKMKFIKVSEIFERQDIKPFLLGVIYSRNIITPSKKYFVLSCRFKKSVKVFKSDFDYDNYKIKYRDVLTYESGFEWKLNSEIKETNIKELISIAGDYKLVFENDLKLMNSQSLYLFISQILLRSPWVINDKDLNFEKRMFIRGFVEPRGSIDTTRPYISQDYFYHDSREASRINWLLSYNIIPYYACNINFRNLQKQHVEGTNKRNTQFRVNLFWYLSNIGLYNEYKIKIAQNVYSALKNKKIIDERAIGFNCEMPAFDKENNEINYVISFYLNNIVDKDLTKNEIDKYRKKLGLVNTGGGETPRDKKIIDIFREISEDKCALCGTTKTYAEKNTGRQHFEIHHVVSVASGSKEDLDKIENLVKLCPTCHDSLKKGATTVEKQIELCKQILENNEIVFNFCSAYFGTDNINILAERVQENLK